MRSPFAVRVSELTLTPLDPQPDHDVVAGDPVVSLLELSTSDDGRVERGVWQITPGVVRDVEADELFVVISGSATIEFDDGAPALDVGPGDAAILPAGARTTWTIHETLRKVYQATV
ncbi:cupin domain-containing protein [Conexibacter woesei]|uniref:(S)-ureidoglycine aminohydrolase cupin domain-containing protein n=1 Tax=Conexibacter woesei (strain DSM 14684 / CCUG 47730 / CIP 108061 / JCM 11494 / NBRC 100937 / ID131577) TaxID=469383 RepID=D3F1T4_CONWI|nr:cupin domain-containing protein [Conexibacter woesei]ADB54115.1 protein of unknown function DUF861 cupin_3 [Conexibacter woesei DSM 14684]